MKSSLITIIVFFCLSSVALGIGERNVTQSNSKDKSEIMKAYLEKSERYKSAGILDSSLQFRLRYYHVKDSLGLQESSKRYDDLLAKRNISGLKRKTLYSEHKSRRMKIINEHAQFMKSGAIVSGIVVAGLALLVIFFQLRTLYRRKLILEKSKEMRHVQNALMETDLQRKMLEQKQLEQEVSEKNVELQRFMSEVVRSNEFSKDLLERLKVAAKEGDQALREVIFYLHSRLENNSQFEALEDRIRTSNEKFYEKLMISFPAITQNECKLASWIRLGLTSKEIAGMKRVEVSSIEIARHRLRKKLQLGKSQNLIDFLKEF